MSTCQDRVISVTWEKVQAHTRKEKNVKKTKRRKLFLRVYKEEQKALEKQHIVISLLSDVQHSRVVETNNGPQECNVTLMYSTRGGLFHANAY